MQRVPCHLLHDPAYAQAALRLETQGYTSEKQTSGIFPLLFSRGKETVYLFRAALDGRNSYPVEWTDSDDLVPADFQGTGRPTLLIPKALYIAPARDITRYYWVPRLRKQAPPLLAGGMLTKQDIAEMLGLALSTVQGAMSDSENRLVPVSTLNNAPLFKVADAIAWNNRRMRGHRERKGNTYEKAYASLSKNALLRRIVHDLSLGRVTEQELFDGLRSLYGETVTNLDTLLAYLSTLQRKEVLAFSSACGIITPAPGEKSAQPSKGITER